MDLSILIPARNEMFLAKTISNILENIEGKTEIIAVLDGNWPDPPIEDNPKVHLIYHSQSIGQRAATNEAARYSRAKFIMKCDAHCAFDKGFDVKLMADCDYDATIVPRMYNLHAFDWVCKKCGNTTYQGPTPTSCPKCDNKSEFIRDIKWIAKHNPQSDFFRFDKELHFQYWREFRDRPEAKGDLAPTMSLLGACWFMHRQRFWDLDGCDEEHGSWGQMGTEIACKSWLSGGKLLVNKKTWFAHMFRTQGGDFGFPYPNPGIRHARKRSQELWIKGKWPKAKYDLNWLLEKFRPVPEWHDLSAPVTVQGIKKGMVYYTDNRCDATIFNTCQEYLKKNVNGFPVVSVSLKPIDFGDNIVLPLERGILTMFKQILAGLEKSTADVIYFVEHDVIYHPSHFEFVPPRKDVFYYNENVWKVRSTDGQAVFFHTKQTSGLCAYRELLLEHYRKRVERVEKEGFSRNMGFEPGTHSFPRGVDNYKAQAYFSTHPNVDIRHDQNLTWSRFKPEQYRNKRSIIGWKLADEIPFWGKTKGRFWEFLNDALQKA